MLHARRRAVRSAFLASLGNPGFHAITQDIAREFREHCKHASECASGLGVCPSNRSAKLLKGKLSRISGHV